MEYALIIAAVVVMSLGAIQSLQSESNDEVQNEFDCISERPPPPSCQKRAVTTTTSTTISATTSTTQPEPTTSSTDSTTTTTTTSTTTPDPSTSSTTVAPFVTTASWPGTGRTTSPRGPAWSARTRLTLTDPSGELLIGAVVTIEVFDTSNGAVLGSYECTTAEESGRCTTTGGSERPYQVIPGNVGSVQFRVASVSYTPPAAVPTQTSSVVERP